MCHDNLFVSKAEDIFPLWIALLSGEAKAMHNTGLEYYTNTHKLGQKSLGSFLSPMGKTTKKANHSLLSLLL